MAYFSNNRRSYHAQTRRRPQGGNRRTLNKKGINPSRFVQAAKVREIEPYEPFYAFSDFAIDDLIQRNLAAKGIVTPSPIQDQSIPMGLEGRDIVGIANTGTGKTLAFAIPVLQKLITNPSSKVLIMAPTRELAQQIEDECRQIAKGSGLFGALLIGGAPMGPQLGDLRNKPAIVIGTPGRIKDHLERGSLRLDDFNTVVLDEVDRMLDMGFVQDMRDILGQLAEERQSFFFSATMDNRVRTLMQQFVADPVTVSVKTAETSENVEQNVVHYTSKEDKIEKLHDILITENVAKVLVFDETQRNVERLHKELQTRGFKAEAIHGGKTQGHRQRALTRFKTNAVTILVATDVAARGIDVADITHVVNYTAPESYDDYVHRIGRAGRAGRTGHALTFVGR